MRSMQAPIDHQPANQPSDRMSATCRFERLPEKRYSAPQLGDFSEAFNQDLLTRDSVS